MTDLLKDLKVPLNRRSFVSGLMAVGAAAISADVLAQVPSAIAKTAAQQRVGSLSTGDAALLRFAAAAEILESDFWVQYNELGGIQDSEVPGGSGNKFYTAKLANLDSDFAQTFTTTPTTKSPTSHSLMPTWWRTERKLSIWTSSAPSKGVPQLASTEI